MDVEKLRQFRPDLVGETDDVVLRAISLDYPEIPPEKITADFGLATAQALAPSRTVMGAAGDVGVSLLKGAIAVPEAAVGLADMVSGGHVGKALEGIGYRPQEASSMLDDAYSDPQKAAFQRVQAEHGILPVLGAALSNPSVVAHSVLQSLPSMAAGGIAGGALARAAGLSAAVGGAVGEGLTMAGQDAEQIRAANADKLLTAGQAGTAAAIGALGGGLALVGAKVAKALKINDVDTLFAGGAANPVAGKNVLRRMLEGAVAEGVLEELPQSVMEQVLINHATGKPLEEGLDQAAVLGMLAGGVMGGGAQMLGGKAAQTNATVPPGAPSTPPQGPMLGLPAPVITVGPDGTAATAEQRNTQRAEDVPYREIDRRGPLQTAATTAQANTGAALREGSAPGADIKEAVANIIADGEKGPQLVGFPAPEAVDERADRDEQIYNEATAGLPMVERSDYDDSDLPPITSDLDAAAHEAATSPHNDRPEPTEAQKQANNYKAGHIKVQGLDITVENPQGSERRGKRPDGTEWAHTMSNHYGYIKRTEGADGEQVDVYVGPRPDAPKVYAIDQVNQHDHSFDEVKAMIGFANRGAAVRAYRSNFDKGWTMGRVTEMPMDQFKAWLKDGDMKKPASPHGPMEAKGTTNVPKVKEAPADASGNLFQGETGAVIPAAVPPAGVSAPIVAAPETVAPSPAVQAPVAADAVPEQPVGAANAEGTEPKEGKGPAAPGVEQAQAGSPEAAGAPAAVAPAGRTVRVNEQDVTLTPEQAKAWDTATQEADDARTDAEARYQRERKQAQPENPDVGLKSPKERRDAELKRIGMQLSAKRRKIAGAQTGKEKQAEAKEAEKFKAGDRVTVDGKGWFRALYEGREVWTNGHILDLQGDPHLPGWEGRKDGLGRDKEEKKMDAGRVIPKAKGALAVPFGRYDGKYGSAAKGLVYFDAGGRLIGADSNYVSYFLSKYKGATFTASDDKLQVWSGDKLVGIVMPVAFVNGEQAAQRFSLDKQIDSLGWTPYTVDGSVKMVVVKIPGENILRLGVDKEGNVNQAAGPGFARAKGKPLDEVIGKDLAAKIMSESTGNLEGDGLKMEAPGMRAFYDKIVPSVAKDVIRKLAGGKVDMGSVMIDPKANGAKVGDPDEAWPFVVYRSGRIINRHANQQGAEDEVAEFRESDKRTGNTDPTLRWEQVKSTALQQPGFDITDAMREKAAGGVPLFKQSGSGDATPQAVGKLQALADAITEKWGKKIEVVVTSSVFAPATPKEVQAEARKLIKNGGAIPSGVLYGGRMYVFADQVDGAKMAVEIIMHESKGHIGLRGNFGKELDAILRQIAQARPAQIAAMIRKNGFQAHERLRAAEEVLAEMSAKEPTLGFVRRAIAAIRVWIRSLGFKVNLTDDEIIQAVLTPAANYIETGRRTGLGAAPALLSDPSRLMTGGAKRGSRESVPIQGGGKSAEWNADNLGDILENPAFRYQGLRGLEIPDQRAVLDTMVMVLHDPQILDAVVHSVPVNMVNDLAGEKGAPEVLLHDKSVLKHLAAINSKDSVPAIIDKASGLVLATAFVRAKRAVRSIQGGLSLELDSAMGAFKRDLAAAMKPDTGIATEGSGAWSKVVRLAMEADAAVRAGKIEDRHGVTPLSDDVLGAEDADTSFAPTQILPLFSQSERTPEASFDRMQQLAAQDLREVQERSGHKGKAEFVAWLASEAATDLSTEDDWLAQINGLRVIAGLQDADAVMFSQAERTVEVAGKRYPVEDSTGHLVHPTFAGQVNFWKFFAGSKVTDEKGKPLVVYHGTRADIKGAMQPSTVSDGHTYDGIYVTAKVGEASRYAGADNGANVLPLYARITNPARDEDISRVIKEYEARTGKPAEGSALNEALSEAGFDGIIEGKNIADADEIVAFDPEQVKSALGNNGEFSPESGNIMFSQGIADAADFWRDKWARDKDGKPVKAETISVYDKARDLRKRGLLSEDKFREWREQPMEDFEQKVQALYDKNPPEMNWTKDELKTMFGLTPEDTKRDRSIQGVADRRIRDMLTGITVTSLKSRAGHTAADYRGVALSLLGRRQIAEIFAKDLPELESYNRLVQQMDADKNEAGAGADEVARDWGKLADDRQLAELMHDATLAQIDPAKDHAAGDRRGEYDRLRKLFDALTPQAQSIYKRARDMYEEHYSQVRESVRDRIERSEMTNESKAKMLERMDGEFFDKIKGVYFPLARFGQYVVTVKDAAGTTASVNRAETMAAADEMRAQLIAAYPATHGFKVGKVLKTSEFNASRDGVGRGFMRELFDVLDREGLGEELQDAVNQLYLSSLPDLSWAKHGIHRKGTPGYSQDARRAFAQNLFHGARYLAKLRYADKLQSQVEAMQRRITTNEGNEEFDSVKAQQVVDEMAKRQDSLLNPKSNALSTLMTSVGFVFHLGLSPASALVNLSQTAMVAYPIMGARWGFGKAGKALTEASRQAAVNRNDISKVLQGDELRAYEQAVKDGTIDVTQAHDLAGIAQGEDSKVVWKVRPVMRAASFLFHHAEKFNRQVTFMAAYRLARAEGESHGTAVEQATKATYDGHFDYAASNRPRVMQGNAARVLLLFKQYGQNMVYTFTRSAYVALKGLNPEDRALARKTIAGLLVTHAMGAGVLGLPLVSTLLAAASLIGGGGDDPWDAETALRNLLADAIGQKPAEVLSRGLSRLTPWDVSSRVALDKLIFPDVQEGLEGARWFESMASAALGPVAGIGLNAAKGAQEITQGHLARGLETMMPAALRGPMRAIRYGKEGAMDKSGVSLVDEVGAAGIAGQALGFSPSDVRNATEGKSAIYQMDRMVEERRKSLLRQYTSAMLASDQEGVADAREDIKAFNEKQPARRILPKNMRASLVNRRKRIAEAEQGIYLPKNRRGAMDAGAFSRE